MVFMVNWYYQWRGGVGPSEYFEDVITQQLDPKFDQYCTNSKWTTKLPIAFRFNLRIYDSIATTDYNNPYLHSHDKREIKALQQLFKRNNSIIELDMFFYCFTALGLLSEPIKNPLCIVCQKVTWTSTLSWNSIFGRPFKVLVDPDFIDEEAFTMVLVIRGGNLSFCSLPGKRRKRRKSLVMNLTVG